MRRLIRHFIFLSFCFVFNQLGYAQDIIINSNTTWQAGIYTYDNVTITNNAVLIFNGAVTLNAENVTVELGSSISANETGYKGGVRENTPGEGPGGGGSVNFYASGGGYGGKGADGIFGVLGGNTYGSAIAPVNLGSGGGGSSDLQWGFIRKGGNGGGAIKIVVSDILILNGSITASGENGASGNGGSGGSVYIITSALTGSGLIKANGGNAGGGGRIAVYYKTTTFSGNAEANGGGRGTANIASEDGTVVFIDTRNNIFYSGRTFRFQENDTPFNFNTIIIDNSIVTNEGSVSLSADSLRIKNGSDFKLGSASTINVNNNLELITNANFTLNGSTNVKVGGLLKLDGASSFSFTGGQFFAVPHITLNAGSTLTLAEENNLTTSDIVLTNSSVITHTPKGRIFLNAARINLDATSSISANEKGYAGGTYGNIPGEGPGGGKSMMGYFAGGGGYGGRGGGECPFGHIFLGGASYGSAIAPVDLGSGGGGTTDPQWGFQHKGGSGGGAIKLVISDTLTLNGSITANGTSAGGGTLFASGGSGGSVYIITSSLTGAGSITANGGNGGGGGGRIAVYYKAASFSGSSEAKGGSSNPPAEDGTVVMNGLVSDFPVTFFNLIEESSTISTFIETISSQKASLNDVTVTGDLNATIDFVNLEFVTVTTGTFSNKGFSLGEFEATFEGAAYRGSYKGMTYFIPSEKKIYLKAKLEGELSGICEATLAESVPDSGIYDKYQASWKLNRLNIDTTSAVINLEGVLSYQPSDTFISNLYLYQSNMEGNASGYYTSPLSAVITHLRFDSENEYKGQGFSIISYNTFLGQGESWAYNSVNAPKIVEFHGLFKEPLLGKLCAVLDENKFPKTLTGTIERLDLGVAPAVDLKVSILGPSRVSPGQPKVNYVIEYVNNGLKKAAEAVILINIDPFVAYSASSHGGEYNDITYLMGWELHDVMPKSRGYLTTTVDVNSGMPLGAAVEHTAYITQIETTPSIEKKNLFLNGIGLKSKDNAYNNKLKDFACKIGAEHAEVFKDISLLDAVEDTALAAKNLSSDTNGLKDPLVVGGKKYDTVYAYSGGTATVVSALASGRMKADTLVLISPIYAGTFNQFLSDLQFVKAFGEVKHIIIYQSENDYLAPSIAQLLIPKDLFQVKIPKDRSLPDIEVRNRDNVKHSDWIQFLNSDEDDKKLLSFKSIITTAHDPNELIVFPEGSVKPGDKLTYTINYENEGEGDAYGVYITDILEDDLDDSTLAVNNGGKYDHGIRAITWFIGELPSKQKGSVTFSVNVNNDAVDKAEVINFATVYFPSVLETTRTNGAVNTVTTLIDNAAPTTVISTVPPANQAGWNNTDILINLSASDNDGGTGVKDIHYKLTGASSDERTILGVSARVIISSEGTTNLSCYSVDNAGNPEVPKNFVVKIDKTPPAITVNSAPQANANGWNNSDVTVNFTATDNLSGVANVTEPAVVTSEGKEQNIGGEAIDLAGNRTTAYTVVNLDKTPPRVSVTTNPNLLWPPNHKMVPVIIGGQVIDTLSGIDKTVFDIKDEYGKFQPVILAFNSVIQLEVWRKGNDYDGRVYTICAVVKDKAGNQAESSTAVICPHDQGNSLKKEVIGQ